MNLGQTMITIGMFTLLMMTVISANRILIENAEAELQVESLLPSSVMASGLLQEIMRKPFDQRVVIDTTVTPWRQDTTGTKVGAVTGLSAETNTWLWGVRNRIVLPDSNYLGNYNSIANLKDIDDYDGYVRIARYNNLSVTLTVNVWYVVYTSPDVPSSSQQWFKKIEVTVQHPQSATNQVYSAIASY